MLQSATSSKVLQKLCKLTYPEFDVFFFAYFLPETAFSPPFEFYLINNIKTKDDEGTSKSQNL
jgi:hypothetical protein